MMERQCYSIAKSNRSSSEEKPANESKKEEIKKEKVENKNNFKPRTQCYKTNYYGNLLQ